MICIYELRVLNARALNFFIPTCRPYPLFGKWVQIAELSKAELGHHKIQFLQPPTQQISWHQCSGCDRRKGACFRSNNVCSGGDPQSVREKVVVCMALLDYANITCSKVVVCMTELLVCVTYGVRNGGNGGVSGKWGPHADHPDNATT